MTIGIQTLNRENEAIHFNEILNSYFRMSKSSDKRRKRPTIQQAQIQSTENDSKTCLKQLKRLLRDADVAIQSQYIQKLYACVLYQLKRAKTSPSILSRVMELCQEIFRRSAMFRALIATNSASFFNQLLLSAGDNPNANVSRALRARSRDSKQVLAVLTLIETWKQEFGERYPSMVAGYSTLVERGYCFPNKREKQQKESEIEAERERHREQVLHVKRQQRDREMKQFVPEMEIVLIEMNRVFEILIPTLDTFLVGDHNHEERKEALSAGHRKFYNTEEIDEESSGRGSALTKEHYGENLQWEKESILNTNLEAETEESVEWESVIGNEDDASDKNVIASQSSDEDQMDVNDIVQKYGLGSSSYQLTVEVPNKMCEESSDNDALFKALADSAIRIRKRFLPLLSDWQQHSTLTDQSSSSPSVLPSQREILQQILDLRDRMTRALLKWDDLNGSKVVQDETFVQSAVVSLPLESYSSPTKRRRQQ
ncbi:uv-stimulated scaffold protein a isoform x2 [Plasmopara halstedii]|uniref:Uv-stimulated scaffold protein a isoform x2 n=1 Tax=Plasmopara halstedii TaxID=4781 RepID=A0A0P1AJX0_PLAHL|nr:uv-stimulated scaffold protein a isoform x2 [Plasmopara halstedii]CEG41530.1 uv-stimulated scaffold protein a isoform x2 [Plasmopara halstedii]|eukprot:XP_024577899.1 uv-stimulated scaffold protein a isoform x2 [Plasmopara halstedii]